MGEGRFEIGQKERNQLKVLREGRERQITQQQAAEQLGLTERPVRRLMARIRTVEIDLWCTACVAQDSTEEIGNVWSYTAGLWSSTPMKPACSRWRRSCRTSEKASNSR